MTCTSLATDSIFGVCVRVRMSLRFFYFLGDYLVIVFKKVVRVCVYVWRERERE